MLWQLSSSIDTFCWILVSPYLRKMLSDFPLKGRHHLLWVRAYLSGTSCVSMVFSWFQYWNLIIKISIFFRRCDRAAETKSLWRYYCTWDGCLYIHMFQQGVDICTYGFVIICKITNYPSSKARVFCFHKSIVDLLCRVVYQYFSHFSAGKLVSC